MITASSFVRAALGAAIVSLAGCETAPTVPTSLFTTQTFNGTVARSGSVSHTFTTQQTSPAVIRMTSFSPQVTMGLALGSPAGNACQVTVGQAAVRQGDEFQVPLEPSTYCVLIFDIGNVAASTSVAYSIVVQHR